MDLNPMSLTTQMALRRDRSWALADFSGHRGIFLWFPVWRR
jgi:hypothetical protein